LGLKVKIKKKEFAVQFSDDQKIAYDKILELLSSSGVNVESKSLSPLNQKKNKEVAIIGKAGSGKTLLLAKIVTDLNELGVETVSGEYQPAKINDKRTLAILAPTNKAASVIRQQGVAATTIHRILYSPIYDPEYEKIADWLNGKQDKPIIDGLTDDALKRAESFFKSNKSIPGALAVAGLRGSDFITGWKRREEPLDIGFVDESSMLDEKQLSDLRDIFSTLILFGDPAQLAPVGNSGKMVFDDIDDSRKIELHRIHRQEFDSPILDLAHFLADPDITFNDFENEIVQASSRDERVIVSERVISDMMARSPVLVWRNSTRIRLIQAFRNSYNAPDDELLVGEPLICDGIELPLKHRKKRLDLEARGLIKGAHAIFLGNGRKPGFSRLHVVGAEDPYVSAASIIKIEKNDKDEPFIPFAARMGAAFLHGSAVTIHKSQGSQWPQVQVFGPDIFVAAKTERIESDLPLWKRLAYVSITRAQEKLIWVTQYRLSKPTSPLSTSDLKP
tara:strand:+ start:5058 stop:6572 length:1515 start_codon:yes stop_codon:yes gene_type:complete